jgi:HK97 family phage major capsid protein
VNPRLKQIDARKSEITSLIQGLQALPQPPELGDDANETQRAQRAQTLKDRFDEENSLLDEAEQLEAEAKPLRDQEARRARLLADAAEQVRRDQGNPWNIDDRGNGGGNNSPLNGGTGSGGGRNDPTVLMRTKGMTGDPYNNLDAVRSRSISEGEMVARGRRAVEIAPEWVQDAYKTEADHMIARASRRQRPLFAQHVLLTGSERYTESFLDYMANPIDHAQRAALSLTNANGGYLVPFTLDPTIVLTNAGSANPYRAVATVKRTATNTWNGVASTGMNAAWLAEAGVVADASPTFSNIVITPQTGSAWVFGSYEILEDSDFETELPGLLADAKDRLEEAAFATGTGSGQPKGIITAATTVYTTADTTGHTIAVADVFGIQAALPARFRRNASWVASISAINRFRQLDTAGGSSYWTNLGQGQPERLLGGGIYESTSIAAYTAAAAGQLPAVYGDFSQYAIVDRIGMSVMYEPMVKDPTTARPTGQGGWFAFWRVGADALVPGAFRVLKTG